MDPRFTRGEYWLLESVVEHEEIISALIGRDHELHFNKKGHGLTRAPLAETLHRLLSSGLIYAGSRLRFSDEELDFILTPEQIEMALDESKSWVGVPLRERRVTCYGLTQEGGAQWEAFAAPDWQKYIDICYGWTDDRESMSCEVICADKGWLERYFESLCFYNPDEVVLDSVERDYIAPWQATYWKQLEGAHRIRFREPDESEQENLLQLSPPSLPDMGYFDKLWCAWR